MAEFKYDDNLWLDMCMDTPFRGPEHENAKTAEEAACIPGNAVKSVERDNTGFYKYFGVLVRFGDTCVVRSHADGFSGKFVWEGTQEEYHKTWMVD